MAKAKTTTAAPAKDLKTLRADLLLAQRGLHDGTLTNPHKIKAIRKDIARLLTSQKENQ